MRMETIGHFLLITKVEAQNMTRQAKGEGSHVVGKTRAWETLFAIETGRKSVLGRPPKHLLSRLYQALLHFLGVPGQLSHLTTLEDQEVSRRSYRIIHKGQWRSPWGG